MLENQNKMDPERILQDDIRRIEEDICQALLRGMIRYGKEMYYYDRFKTVLPLLTQLEERISEKKRRLNKNGGASLGGSMDELVERGVTVKADERRKLEESLAFADEELRQAGNGVAFSAVLAGNERRLEDACGQLTDGLTADAVRALLSLLHGDVAEAVGIASRSENCEKILVFLLSCTSEEYPEDVLCILGKMKELEYLSVTGIRLTGNYLYCKNEALHRAAVDALMPSVAQFSSERFKTVFTAETKRMFESLYELPTDGYATLRQYDSDYEGLLYTLGLAKTHSKIYGRAKRVFDFNGESETEALRLKIALSLKDEKKEDYDGWVREVNRAFLFEDGFSGELRRDLLSYFAPYLRAVEEDFVLGYRSRYNEERVLCFGETEVPVTCKPHESSGSVFSRWSQIKNRQSEIWKEYAQKEYKKRTETVRFAPSVAMLVIAALFCVLMCVAATLSLHVLLTVACAIGFGVFFFFGVYLVIELCAYEHTEARAIKCELEEMQKAVGLAELEIEAYRDEYIANDDRFVAFVELLQRYE